jgi:hypothetical protein
MFPPGFSTGEQVYVHALTHDANSSTASSRITGQALPVHSDVQPARSDTQPGAVQAEIDVNAGSDANRTAEAEGHRPLARAMIWLAIEISSFFIS